VRDRIGAGVLVGCWSGIGRGQTDVQVEAVLSEMRGCGKRNGALGGSGIAAREESTYQGESRMLDSPGTVCPGQAGSEYPATSVPFSN
jgi:hypothetical protein